MPGFDRTGPMGQGPASGWGRGLCGTGSAWGFGRGRGMGRGRGFRGQGRGIAGFFGRGPRAYGAPWGPAPADEAEMLKSELSAAREEVAAMEARLQELEKDRTD